MRNIKCLVSLLFILFSISCSEDKEEPEEVYDPIVLSKRKMWVTHINTADTIYILSGNGDYKITEFTLIKGTNDELAGIPLENIIKVYIEDDKVIAKRLLLEDNFIIGMFVIVDAKGVRKTCSVSNPTQGITEYWPD